MKKLITDLKVSSDDLESYSEWLSNWLKLSKKLSDITDENIVLILMKIELLRAKRPEIVLRLYSRFNTLRRKREKEELLLRIYNA